MKTKIITITGISGGGSRNFCSRYSSEEKKVKVYHTGDMIYNLAQTYTEAPVLIENLLNLHPDILSNLRDKAFGCLLDNLAKDSEDYDRILIDTHAQFFWDHVFRNAYDWHYLNKIPTDLFITIIDKPSNIKKNQLKTEHGRVQNHDLRDLLLWQNVEVNVTKGWASNYGKPMYVFSSKQNPEVIDSLLYNYFLVYTSFPMTDANGKENEKINNFKSRLRSLRKKIDGLETPIIDPSDIDVEADKGLPQKVKDAIDAHTVHRDLDLDIAQSTHIIAYYPDKKTDLSKGVSDECTKARQTGKFVYVICPRKRKSPFMKIAHKVFGEEEEFFTFFEKHMKTALEHFKR